MINNIYAQVPPQGTDNNNLGSSENQRVKIVNFQNENPKFENKNTEIKNTSSCNSNIVLIIIGILIVIGLTIAIPLIVAKLNNKEKYELNENNYISTTAYDDLIIPSDKKLQVVGADFPHKKNTFIIGNKKSFSIDNDGKISKVSKDNFPLYISFNETIKNGSYLFKGVTCFKTVNLSTMDSSEMIDASNMFESSDFEEIYFGTDNSDTNSQSGTNSRNLEENSDEYNEEDDYSEKKERKKYFDTTNIRNSSYMFMNCKKLIKIQLAPFFNVGLKAIGMFKGCTKLKDIDTKLICSDEIEEMESMFEDCQSLQEISFSNDFLTGEIKSLLNVFKNTILLELDIKFLRLFSLEVYSNIFDGASIKGTLKIGKFFSNDNIRDNLFKEISKVTDSATNVFTPRGTTINQIFENIYYSEKHVHISVQVIDIDYNINYKEGGNYKLYTDKLHVGLGWDFSSSNTYDLDSSVLTFDYNIQYLDKVNYQQLSIYNGLIDLNGDDVTGEGDGDDEEIRISLDYLPSEVQIFTVQLNSFRGNSLKDVKSAYIKLSTETEIIGTFSINQAGNNIGLLIGCFSKSTLPTKSGWYFRPLNKVIPGHVVTESVSSIQGILHSIFDNN